VIPGPEIGFEMIASLIWMLDSVGEIGLYTAASGSKLAYAAGASRRPATMARSLSYTSLRTNQMK
jgi:hypothetical protein